MHTHTCMHTHGHAEAHAHNAHIASAHTHSSHLLLSVLAHRAADAATHPRLSSAQSHSHPPPPHLPSTEAPVLSTLPCTAPPGWCCQPRTHRPGLLQTDAQGPRWPSVGFLGFSFAFPPKHTSPGYCFQEAARQSGGSLVWEGGHSDSGSCSAPGPPYILELFCHLSGPVTRAGPRKQKAGSVTSVFLTLVL